MPNFNPYPAQPMGQTLQGLSGGRVNPFVQALRLRTPQANPGAIFNPYTPAVTPDTPQQATIRYNATHAAPSGGHAWVPQGGYQGYLAGNRNFIPAPISTDRTLFNSPSADNLWQNIGYAGLAYGAGAGIAGLSSGGGAGATGAFEGAMAPYQTVGALPAGAGAAGAAGGGTALGATVPVDFAGAGVGGGGASGFLGSGGAAYLGAGTGAYGPVAGAAGASGGGGLLGQLFGGGGWQNAAILGGTNLLGAGIQANAINQANQANRNAIQQRIRQALNELSPQQIQQLVQQFLPEIMSIQNPLMQSQVAQFREAAGQRGLGTAPITGAQETALRASGVNAATQQAFERAMGLAGARAGAITGQPVYQQQPNLAYGNVTGDTLNQLLLARYLQQQPQNPYPYINAGGG